MPDETTKRMDERCHVEEDTPLAAVVYERTSKERGVRKVGMILNLGRGGMGIKVREAFNEDELLEVEFEIPSNDGITKKIKLQGEVRWTEPLGKNFHKVGIMFDIGSRNKHIDDLEKFIAFFK